MKMNLNEKFRKRFCEYTSMKPKLPMSPSTRRDGGMNLFKAALISILLCAFSLSLSLYYTHKTFKKSFILIYTK